MSDPLQDDSGIAQRPRLASRARLLPLLVLCLCVAAAAVVGLVNDSTVTSDLAPAAAPPADPGKDGDEGSKAADRAAEKAKDRCTPKWNNRVRSEPWKGARKKASEKAYKARIAKEHPGYVKGRNGWLFFSDYQANNFSQALGRITQSTAKQKAWAKYLKKAQRLVQEDGGVFQVVVSPATWEIHPEKLPAWAKTLRGTNSLDKLMKAYPKLPWIDTRPALLKAVRKHDTYEPKNSHWTPYGGYVAWQAISKCLATHSGLDKVGAPELQEVDIEPNLNEFALDGVPDGKPARTVPVYTEPLPDTTITQIPSGSEVAPVPDGSLDAVWLPAQTSTPEATSDQTLLVYRDSTGSALSPLWHYSYATTFQYHHGVASTAKPTKVAKVIAKHHPDVFLYVITERFLDTMPPRA